MFPADLENELFVLEGHAKRSGREILTKSFVTEVETAAIVLSRKLKMEM